MYACFGIANNACCSGGCWVTELLSSEQWCTAEACWWYRRLQCASRLPLQPGSLRPTSQSSVVMLLCKNKLTSPWCHAVCLSKAWVKLEQFLNSCSWHRVLHRMWKRFFGVRSVEPAYILPYWAREWVWLLGKPSVVCAASVVWVQGSSGCALPSCGPRAMRGAALISAAVIPHSKCCEGLFTSSPFQMLCWAFPQLVPCIEPCFKLPFDFAQV